MGSTRAEPWRGDLRDQGEKRNRALLVWVDAFGVRGWLPKARLLNEVLGRHRQERRSEYDRGGHSAAAGTCRVLSLAWALWSEWEGFELRLTRERATLERAFFSIASRDP